MLVDACGAPARHPLVVVEPGELGRAALEVGIEIVQRGSGRLLVMTVARQSFMRWMGCAPMCCALIPSQMVNEIEIGEETLAAVRREVPADVPLRTQLIAAVQKARTQILAAAQASGCDLIIAPGSRALGHLGLGLGASLRRTSPIAVRLIQPGPQPQRFVFERGPVDLAAPLEVA